MKYKQMLKIRKSERDPQVRDRILLSTGQNNPLILTKNAGIHRTSSRPPVGLHP